ncbi:unnamed protein product [Diatraea saccharalis]|uniref:Glucosidase II beta subunit N-terminal domain-containing protein n=1 Tax=Diatraea saccharalis TaxID=40085 RepID=A0A9N9R0L2_9NEOP|nr:unnamed protein product [Diatraea saccharalis]
MGLKKKKNVIILTCCMIVSFTLYQLYFFLTITSEVANGNKIISVVDHSQIREPKNALKRSEQDKYINDNGIIRGIQYSSVLKYRADSNNEFKCLYSEQRIPFDYVNDDYCDCEDSTDEPSTSACVNGTFYCDTQYPGKNIVLNTVPSNRVNDGICDCCDGSDEWLHSHNELILSQSSQKHYRHYVNKCSSNCYK